MLFSLFVLLNDVSKLFIYFLPVPATSIKRNPYRPVSICTGRTSIFPGLQAPDDKGLAASHSKCSLHKCDLTSLIRERQVEHFSAPLLNPSINQTGTSKRIIWDLELLTVKANKTAGVQGKSYKDLQYSYRLKPHRIFAWHLQGDLIGSSIKLYLRTSSVGTSYLILF